MLRTLFNNRELRKVPLPKKEGLKQKSKLQKLCSPINRNPEAAAKGWLRLRRENFEFGGVKWLFWLILGVPKPLQALVLFIILNVKLLLFPNLIVVTVLLLTIQQCSPLNVREL